MSDDPESELLSRLPRRRPHRRSDKRAAPQPARLRQPAQPKSTPAPAPASEAARARSFSSAGGAEILGTAVQAAAELAEIGLSVGARALRQAVSRLPSP